MVRVLHFIRSFSFGGAQTKVINLLVFVLPPITEPFGLALVEAMAAGIPVIASNVGGIAEIISHKDTGLLIEPGSPRAIADSILWILRHKEKAVEMAARATKVANERFFSRRMAAKFEQICLEIPGRR